MFEILFIYFFNIYYANTYKFIKPFIFVQLKLMVYNGKTYLR